MQTDGQDESLEQTAAGAFVAVFSFRVTDFPSFAHLLPFVARTRDRRRADSTRSASHERAGEALRAAAGQRHARALARLDRLSTPPLDPRRLERAAFRPPNTGQTCTATNAVLELRLAVARRYGRVRIAVLCVGVVTVRDPTKNETSQTKKSQRTASDDRGDLD